MTPKEKAIELVGKFTEPTEEWVDDDRAYGWIPNIENAKACALIAVDEILKSEATFHSCLDKTTDYWQEVKEAINQL